MPTGGSAYLSSAYWRLCLLEALLSSYLRLCLLERDAYWSLCLLEAMPQVTEPLSVVTAMLLFSYLSDASSY